MTTSPALRQICNNVRAEEGFVSQWQVNGPDLVNVINWSHKVEVELNLNSVFRVIKDSVLCAGKHNLDLRGTFYHQRQLDLL